MLFAWRANSKNENDKSSIFGWDSSVRNRHGSRRQWDLQAIKWSGSVPTRWLKLSRWISELPNWNEIVRISSCSQLLERKPNSSSLIASSWNNFIFIKPSRSSGIVYDPVSEKVCRVRGTYCSHRNCTLTVTDTSIICSGYPCRSIG